MIQVYRLGERYNGIYTIMDTGPAVQGRHIDIYMWSCNEALEFGRRDIADQRPAPRLESAGEHADPDRAPVPPPRGALRRATPAAIRLPVAISDPVTESLPSQAAFETTASVRDS